MPHKLEVNEQLVFLWDCFQSSRNNGGKVDIKAVGELYKLSSGAANMRLHRLAGSIEKAKENAASSSGGDAKESGEEGTPKSKPKAKKSIKEKPSTPKNKRKQVAEDEEEPFEDEGSFEKESKKIKVEQDYEDEVI